MSDDTPRRKPNDDEIRHGANLSGCDLAGRDLREAKLWLADLTGANLTGANLTSRTEQQCGDGLVTYGSCDVTDSSLGSG